MTIDEVLTYFGHKQVNVAKALGLHRQIVYKWWKSKRIPYEKQCVIEVFTHGALKANKDH